LPLPPAVDRRHAKGNYFWWTRGLQREIISGGPEACRGKLFLPEGAQIPLEGW